MHRLNLLGGASIEGPEGPLDSAIAQRQRLAFLAVLSAPPGGLVSRDKLLALLWPDLDAGRARRALSNALYVIKKELGEDSVLAVGDDLRLGTGFVAVDAREFEEAVKVGELEKAVSIYAGPYLDGIHVKDSPEFEKWADGERDRLAGLFADALEGLAERATQAGDHKGAAQWWERLAVADPYSSRIALGFMRALAAAADKAGALRYAQIHTTLLREEFDAEPDRAVTELEEELRKEGPQGRSDHAPAETTPEGPGRPLEPVGVPSTAPPLDAAPGVSAPSEASKEGHPALSPRALMDGAVLRAGKQRLFQWGLAYLAGAWFVLQGLDVFSGVWDLSRGFHQTVLVFLTFGFFLTLVLVWYHGEKGRQRVTGPELLIIAALLFIAGGVLSFTGSPEAGTPGRPGDNPPPEGDGRPTLAVLPFQNFSPNAEDAYFADGMHEEILTKLSGLDSLRVISRSSVMQFREDRPTAQEIASLLGADYLLEGSARIAGGFVRLTAQLIDARTDDHIWSADFDQPLNLDSLFVVQGFIADSVAGRTRTTLTPGDRDQIDRRPTDNLEAYELYLHGRFLWNQRTDSEIRQAIQLFQEAIALDSMYAYAYLGVAEAYLTLLSWDYMTFDEAMPPAEEALLRALAIDSLMGEAHASMGVVLESHVDIPGAIASFQRCFELTPDYATGHSWFALLLAKIGYFEDALTHIRYAAGLDPLSRTIDANIGHILHLSRDHESAVRHLEGVTQRFPDFNHGWTVLGRAHAALGQYEDALAAMGRSVELVPWPNPILQLAWIHAMAGDSDQARALLEQAEQGFDRSDPLRRAQVHGALGDTDLALQFLEEGIQIRSPTVAYLGVDPMWDPMRSDPGFKAVLDRLGFRQTGG
jgi:TolB-like protein/DNA-binding SARP family transcriptional activator/Tfp pilus assembly protein PilF